MHSCGFNLSAWHSTSSLASISEERDITLNGTTNKCFPRYSLNTSNYSQFQDIIPNLFGNKNVIENSSDGSNSAQYSAQQQCRTLQDNHNIKTHSGNNEKVLNHSLNNMLKSSILQTEGLTSTDMNKLAAHSEPTFQSILNRHSFNNDEGSIPCTQSIPTKYHSISKNFNHYKDHKHVSNSDNIYQKQRIVQLESPQHLSRNRSQSVHGHFLYFSDGKENDFECDVHNQIRVRSKIHNPHKSPLQPVSSFSPQSRVKSKSISWDNLLAVIGLQRDSESADNDIMEQDCDEVFKNVVPTEETIPEGSLKENDQAVQIKKMRSQSFTSGCSLTPSSKYRLWGTKVPVQGIHIKHENVKCHNNIDDENLDLVHMRLIGYEKQITKEINSTLLRRASIQCEAVLTQTSAPRKIVNPLQDVDISSLQSPGPLHAVTLQYTSMSMTKTLDNKAIPTTNAFTKPNITLVSPKTAFNVTTPSSKVVNHVRHVLQSNNESRDSSSPLFHVAQLQHGKSKVIVTKPYISNATQKNNLSGHQIAQPQTSILKALSQVHPQENGSIASKESGEFKQTNEFSSKKLAYEENISKDTKSDKDLFQNSNVSALHMLISNSPILVDNKEQVCLTNAKNVTLFNVALQRPDVLTENQNILSTQNAASGCSVAESDKVHLNTLTEQDIERSNVQNHGHIDCPSNDKTASNSNCSIAALRDFDPKLINKSENIKSSILSLHDKVHFTEDRSWTVKAESIDSMSPFIPSSQKHFIYTPDVSMFSDEGYGTSDCTSTQSHSLVNYGHCQPQDVNSSLSSNNVAKVSCFKDLPCSLNKPICDSQTQHKPSDMRSLSYVNLSAKKEHQTSNKNRDNAKVKFNNVTNNIAGDKFQSDVKQDITVVVDLPSCHHPEHGSSTQHHSYSSNSKHTISSQKDFTKSDYFAETGTNLKSSNDDHINSRIMELEEQRQTDENILPVTRQSHDSVNTDKNITLSFRQTAV